MPVLEVDPDLCIPLLGVSELESVGTILQVVNMHAWSPQLPFLGCIWVHHVHPGIIWHQVPERRWRPHYSHPAQACPNEANRVSTWVCQRMQYIILYNLLAISKTPIEILTDSDISHQCLSSMCPAGLKLLQARSWHIRSPNNQLTAAWAWS